MKYIERNIAKTKQEKLLLLLICFLILSLTNINLVFNMKVKSKSSTQSFVFLKNKEKAQSLINFKEFVEGTLKIDINSKDTIDSYDNTISEAILFNLNNKYSTKLGKKAIEDNCDTSDDCNISIKGFNIYFDSDEFNNHLEIKKIMNLVSTRNIDGSFSLDYRHFKNCDIKIKDLDSNSIEIEFKIKQKEKINELRELVNSKYTSYNIRIIISKNKIEKLIPKQYILKDGPLTGTLASPRKYGNNYRIFINDKFNSYIQESCLQRKLDVNKYKDKLISNFKQYSLIKSEYQVTKKEEKEAKLEIAEIKTNIDDVEKQISNLTSLKNSYTKELSSIEVLSQSTETILNKQLPLEDKLEKELEIIKKKLNVENTLLFAYRKKLKDNEENLNKNQKENQQLILDKAIEDKGIVSEQKVLEGLEEKIKSYYKQNIELNKEKEALEAQLKNDEEKDKEILDLKGKLNNINKEIEDNSKTEINFSKTISINDSRIKEIDEKIAQLNQEKNLLIKENQDYNSRINKIKESSDSLKEQNSQLSVKIKTNQNKINTNKEQMQKILNNQKSINAKTLTIQQKQKLSKTKIEKNQSKLNKYKEEIKENDKTISKTNEVIKSLMSKIKDEEVKQSTIEKEKQDRERKEKEKKDKIIMMKKDLEKILSQKMFLNTELDLSFSNYSMFKDFKKEYEEKLKETTIKYEQLNKLRLELESKLKKSKSIVSAIIEQIKNESEELKLLLDLSMEEFDDFNEKENDMNYADVIKSGTNDVHDKEKTNPEDNGKNETSVIKNDKKTKKLGNFHEKNWLSYLTGIVV